MSRGIKTQAAHLAELETWINDMHSGMFINCVYCGHRYGRKYEEIPAETLRHHVATCPKHPMSKLINEVQAAILMLDGPNQRGSARKKLLKAILEARK